MKDITTLLPIISAYYGCQFQGVGKLKQGLRKQSNCPLTGSIIDLIQLEHFDSFKLHLRKIEDITEEEATEACKILGYSYSTHRNKVAQFEKIWRTLSMPALDWLPVINYLRSKGILCDPILQEKGFVEFVKTEV